jgi:hypothetical protein
VFNQSAADFSHYQSESPLTSASPSDVAERHTGVSCDFGLSRVDLPVRAELLHPRFCAESME